MASAYELTLPREVATAQPSLAILRLWRLRYHARRRIAWLLLADPHLIGDMGLTRAEAETEAAKPFWRA